MTYRKVWNYDVKQEKQFGSQKTYLVIGTAISLSSCL